ncbi:MAG: iron-sulfur cluster assembly protein [Bacteroidales bacterium]|nr:iron-sulfur cluster assembly protein [Bacteroidales bacterium]HOL98528.1 iron-sulfur cluster assembly protein [Bacteroidales bacterium]HOM35687.1 iron-sulfur cluster assembly protein [Bacteroidales bacterium]HPD23173.1 iron-sulfur cluster assembly protein [Bacteroidales bacterium]HRS99102.1 iron-sulfur cluster assembly protein [Bacteroidales bacterium]
MNKTEIEQKIVEALKTVYDPEIPVNVYDLGIIYKIELSENGDVEIDMTLTAPNCPMADELIEDIRSVVKAIDGVRGVSINLVFDPPWSKDMLSESALLDLGLI